MFNFLPDRLLHKQPSFILTFFNARVTVGEDVDFFYFPAYETGPQRRLGEIPTDAMTFRFEDFDLMPG